MSVVELGILIKDIDYKTILDKAHADNCYNCVTHDIYWTNQNLDGMTENEMKNACVRLRDSKLLNKETENTEVELQNLQIFDNTLPNRIRIKKDEVQKYIDLMEAKGFEKIFDTTKTDYQYSIGDMKSRIQIQDIQDIGLVLYYDNPDYYELNEEEQRNKLIDELNSYGFNFKYTDLGIDKLRTLYYKKEMFSENQNGKIESFISLPK